MRRISWAILSTSPYPKHLLSPTLLHLNTPPSDVHSFIPHSSIPTLCVSLPAHENGTCLLLIAQHQAQCLACSTHSIFIDCMDGQKSLIPQGHLSWGADPNASPTLVDISPCPKAGRLRCCSLPRSRCQVDLRAQRGCQP